MRQQEDNINNVVGKYVEQAVSEYERSNVCTVHDVSKGETDSVDIGICNSAKDNIESNDTMNISTKKYRPIEVMGDNLDVSIAPAKMTVEKQRKSLHWFLTMVKQRRVTYDDLSVMSSSPNNVVSPEANQVPIVDVPSTKWIPSTDQINSLQENFVFHISKTLIKYIKFLAPVKDCYPNYIVHQFVDITKEKSVVLNCDLIDASENSSQGMIEILQKVHKLAVPHTQDTVVQKIVFGGDVLTNERAFSAQEAMQNNSNAFDSLCGIIHRPEGLHRQFNFLQVMVLTSYSTPVIVGYACYCSEHVYCCQLDTV